MRPARVRRWAALSCERSDAKGRPPPMERKKKTKSAALKCYINTCPAVPPRGCSFFVSSFSQATSVVANNPDGASDAGQFAIIDKIPKGSSRVSFQFVAAIEPNENFDSKKLKFRSLKAISYAGGKQYGAITECEMNPLAAECDFD